MRKIIEVILWDLPLKTCCHIILSNIYCVPGAILSTSQGLNCIYISQPSFEAYIVINSILQKLRHREIKEVAQGCQLEAGRSGLRLAQFGFGAIFWTMRPSCLWNTWEDPTTTAELLVEELVTEKGTCWLYGCAWEMEPGSHSPWWGMNGSAFKFTRKAMRPDFLLMLGGKSHGYWGPQLGRGAEVSIAPIHWHGKALSFWDAIRVIFFVFSLAYSP